MSNELTCEAGNKLSCMGNKLEKLGGLILLKGKAHSPEILAVLGIGGIIGATVMACKATLKAPDILAKHKEVMDAIEQCHNTDGYTQKDEMQDTVVTYIQTGRDFAALYGPAIILGTVSIGALLGAQFILKKRNVALAAAYSLVERAFKDYRSRVVEELGVEKDYHFMYDTEYDTSITTEVLDEKTGKTKKVKSKLQYLNNPNGLSMYARLYDEQIFDNEGGYSGSSQWSPIPDYNATNLILKNGWANEQLKARGYLFLNDVYEELGFPRTKAGQVVGWVWQGDGDNYVSFGPIIDALLNRTENSDVFRQDAAILLDFNVDGMILDLFENTK